MAICSLLPKIIPRETLMITLTRNCLWTSIIKPTREGRNQYKCVINNVIQQT